MIQAKKVADSLNIFGHRITSLVVTMPRYILAEFNTHRMFTRNSASSRAIPFKKMVKMVEENPFIPYGWQEDHSGMQGTEYLDDKPASYLTEGLDYSEIFRSDILAKDILEGIWAKNSKFSRPNGTAAYQMIEIATELNKYKVTKQLANRLLEPFMWHTALVTSTEWKNFFDLRCPQYNDLDRATWKSRKNMMENSHASQTMKDWTVLDWLKINKGQADIHMMFTAEAIYDAIMESEPKRLDPGQWHLPFGDNIDGNLLIKEHFRLVGEGVRKHSEDNNDLTDLAVKIATARCARTSYNDFEGSSNNYVKDIELHDRLLKSGHWSPFEHSAQAMSEKDLDDYVKIEKGTVYPGWCRNFRGFIQYRSLLDS
jgi:thymidylate synthase ThyX